ncbi:hypothetical protein [Janthinobacterium sp. PC23-8]|uniref:hypothetical protein n=1 Tax=Janthinobacterium sp. PC23-8 TaxID=2012679 RepID=UPI000B962204|nr:hypothetical protein [Janthinobacterium sp. PC23-8]OYO31278.1 hypothetical protein CD932_09220 [Janthinobacterium sp. PC23-8]
MDSKQPQGQPAPGLMVAPTSLPEGLRLTASLPPKGACWYCDKPLDAVRRFCCKGCSEAYAEEAQYHR